MTLQIGILVFPGVQQLDLTGPYEVFASLPDAQVHLVWKDRAPIRSATGLMLGATMTFAECGKLDVICVPGGGGVNALLEDAETLAFIRSQAEQARYVTSVCTGSLVLGAAGLLKGKRATCHWTAIEHLRPLGAIPVSQRVVIDGNIITGAGVAAGIDFALAVAAILEGEEVAKQIQLQIEYDPSPPFNCGSIETASAEMVALLRGRGAALSEQRRVVAERVGKKL